MDAKNAQMEEYHNYHYVFVGFTTFDKVLKQLRQALPFYTFRKTGKGKLKEIFYDEEGHMLSDVGIILSKSMDFVSEGNIMPNCISDCTATELLLSTTTATSFLLVG